MARRLGCVSAILLAAAASTETPHTDKGWELRVTNSVGPQKRVCLSANKLPKYARGLYFIAGPAKFDGSPEGEWHYQSIFDGFGMVNRFELNPADEPGKVCYTSAWMSTGVYQRFLSDPAVPPRGVLFEDTVPSRKPCFLNFCDLTASNDNMWVNMMPIGGEGVWFSDMSNMLMMDLETLEVDGLKPWGDDSTSEHMASPQPDWIEPQHKAAGGSAHPLPRPGTQTVVEIMTEMPLGIGEHYTDVYTFDASMKGKQNRTRLFRIKDKGPQYFHSFGVTPHHVVLIYDLEYSLGFTGKPFLLQAFQPSWRGVHVYDYNGNLIQAFNDLDPFMHVHIANTFENASGIVMDLGAYGDVPFQSSWGVLDIQQSLNKSLRDSKPYALRSQIRRFHFNTVTRAQLFRTPLVGMGLCESYDSAAEMNVLKRYIDSLGEEHRGELQSQLCH